MKQYTLRQKANGEMAVRRMSEKAQWIYGVTDPIAVYEIEANLYDLNVAGDHKKGLTFEEAQEYLEAFADAIAEASDGD